MPRACVHAREWLVTNPAFVSHARVRVHVATHLVGGEEFLVANVTFEKSLARVHVEMARQIAHPSKWFRTSRTEINQLSVHQLFRYVAFFPYFLSSETNVMSETVIVAIMFPTLSTSQHLAPILAAAVINCSAVTKIAGKHVFMTRNK